MTGLVVRRKPQQVVPDRFHALVVIVGQAAGRVITEDCLETLSISDLSINIGYLFHIQIDLYSKETFPFEK
jgi:hypothetical protein